MKVLMIFKDGTECTKEYEGVDDLEKVGYAIHHSFDFIICQGIDGIELRNKREISIVRKLID